MDEAESKMMRKSVDIQARRLSIIDFSSEDDSLIDPVSRYSQDLLSSENWEQRSVELFEPIGAKKLENLDDFLDKEELVPQPSECLEPERKGNNGKYNLRKSLAWDSAFFTSAGVLDPEELSSMTGVQKGEKHILPGIQEEIHRSSDSISTLQSETLTIESIEANLFADIRASIQKSNQASNVEDDSTSDALTEESKTTPASKKMDVASQNKIKPKIASKKPSVSMKHPGKLTRQVSASPEFPQKFAVASGRPTANSLKQPKVLGKPGPSLTTSQNRASLGGNLVKLEKNNAKVAAGGMAPVSKVVSSSRILPRPRPSSKSSSVGTSTKIEAALSTFDSLGSASSENAGKLKSPLNSVKRKIDPRTGNLHSSGTNLKTLPQTALRRKTQPSQPSALTNISSNISPASSISDWSLESISSTSALKQISYSSRTSVETSSSKTASIDSGVTHIWDSQEHSSEQSSVGNETRETSFLGQCAHKPLTEKVALIPASKPSGLRLPSPKIGFFDGVKSVRTPNGSLQSHPVIPSNLPKIGTASASSSAVQSKLKHARLQPLRNGVPNVATKVISASRSDKCCPSPKFKNKEPLEIDRESSKKATKVRIDGDEVDIHDKNTDVRGITDISKYKLSPETKVSTERKDIKITPSSGGNTTISQASHVDNSGNKNVSEEMVEAAIQCENKLRNDLLPHNNINERDNTCYEHLVDCLIEKVGAMDINSVTQKMTDGNSSPFSQLKFSSEDGIGKQLSGPKKVDCSQNSLSEPIQSLSSTALEMTNKRIPFSVKDSLYNMGSLLDVATGTTALEVGKEGQIALSEESA